MTRPRNNAPKTAYDVRRYMTLVQVLAKSGSDQPIRALCESWGVEPVLDPSDPPYLLVWSTLRKLAQHVIDYHHNDTEVS